MPLQPQSFSSLAAEKEEAGEGGGARFAGVGATGLFIPPATHLVGREEEGGGGRGQRQRNRSQAIPIVPPKVCILLSVVFGCVGFIAFLLLFLSFS